ncbi:MAG TPA: hypothetical protein VGM72_05485 [Micropepsaceae bacterium]|jgi:hypothetical protein
MEPHNHDRSPEDDLPPLGTGPSVQATGVLGDYSMMRDSSGTSWQPDTTPMEGVHGLLGDWSTMVHGYISAIYDHQGGPRGGDKSFSESMLMGMAQHSLGPGHLTLRGMISLDPLMGKNGYPLLLQTGETADGSSPLIDRQHPHDLFMELSGTYSAPVADSTSAFLYLGYPGEPALGPPTFMHRFSGMDDPEAPIGHHWLDSTHITYGVATAGIVSGEWKFEGSIFNGRDPDQERWDFDPLRLDSVSGRISWNPNPDWAFQASYGFIKSPEQLEPAINQHRITASAIYNRKLAHGNWQTTFAWGQNIQQPGTASNAYLLESALRWYAHTIFARAENDEKDELFAAPSPLEGHAFNVSKFSLGYIYDIAVAEHLSLGLGAVGSLYGLPSAVKPYYGSNPGSIMLFARVKLT